MTRGIPASWVRMAFLLLLSLAGPVLGQEAPDVAELVRDLSDAGGRGADAFRALKAMPAAPSEVRKAAGELEQDVARRLRARALLSYFEAAGGALEKEQSCLVTVAAWEIPAGSPAFLDLERKAALAALEQSGSEAMPVLLSTYAGDDYGRYQVSRDLLLKLGSAATSQAAALLSHENFVARLRAVHLLALIGGEKEMEAVSAASADANAHVRRRVLEAWLKCGGAWAAKAAAFLADRDASIRSMAVKGLAQVPGAAESAGKLMEDEFFVVRRAAAEAMAGAGGLALERVIGIARSGSAGPGRLEAVRALGAAPRSGPGADSAGSLLEALLGDGDWAVRAAAAAGLALAGGAEKLRPRLDAERHPYVRFCIEGALGIRRRGSPPDAAKFGSPEEGRPSPEGIDAIEWKPEEFAALDDALRALRMTRRDLEFDRNITTDEYRFPSVQTALDRPIEIARITRDAAGRIRGAAISNPAAIFGALAALPGLRHRTESRAAPARVFEGALSLLAGAVLDPGLESAVSVFLSDDSWSAHLDAALARLSAADRARVLSHASELGWDAELLPAWKKVDFGALAEAASRLAAAAGTLAESLGGMDASRAGKGLPWSADTPFGKIAIRGAGRDVHDGPHFLIVDLGGNDAYDGPASAGAAGTADRNAASVVVDVSGDDTYSTTGSCAQGAGFLGIGILIDLGGRDCYTAFANCQGLGWFGAGLLADYGGDDRYEADMVAQGAAGFGLGALVDRGGDDVYYSRAYSQGFGFTGGVAALADAAGNDLYYVDGKYLQYETMPHRKLSMCQGMGFGMRPHASGGIGVLWEGGGDDVYRGNAFAQGSSYWFAMGILVDEEGYDNYSATIYAQSTGIHMGVGSFCDLHGFDNYHAWGLAQSGSHDMGASWFLDAAGEDFYTCQGTCLGGAINHAVAIFVDRAGRDGYFMKDDRAVGSGDGQDTGDNFSLGLFFDLGGREDTYPAQKGGNGLFWSEGTHGIGMDR